MGVEIEYSPSGLSKISGELNGAYNRLSGIKDELESLLSSLRKIWVDKAVEDFSEKYDRGMESIWDLLVAIDSMDSFVVAARDGYNAAENQIASL